MEPRKSKKIQKARKSGKEAGIFIQESHLSPPTLYFRNNRLKSEQIFPPASFINKGNWRHVLLFAFSPNLTGYSTTPLLQSQNSARCRVAFRHGGFPTHPAFVGAGQCPSWRFYYLSPSPDK